MLTISRVHQDFMLPAVDEQAHRVFPEISENGSRAVERMRMGPYTVLAKMLIPALDKAVRKSARMQTYVDAARVACALERYRLANGNCPETSRRWSRGSLPHPQRRHRRQTSSVPLMPTAATSSIPSAGTRPTTTANWAGKTEDGGERGRRQRRLGMADEMDQEALSPRSSGSDVGS